VIAKGGGVPQMGSVRPPGTRRQPHVSAPAGPMSHLRFDGRVAVVTGAGTDLGQRHAVLLAERGAKVLVNDVDAEAAARLVQGIEARGGVAIANSDPTDTPAGGQAVIDAAVNGFGGVDIVIHQSGLLSDPAASAAMLTDADPLALLAGLFGGYWVTRPAWVLMREQRFGRIVLICSFDEAVDEALDGGNTVASLGLLGLMNILKVEGPPQGIKVNMVVPTSAGDPASAGDLTAYLAHEECLPAGEMFTTRADGLARMFMGVNKGIFAPSLTMEAVRDGLDEILNPDTFIVPDEAGEEIAMLLHDLGLE
jgi:NAD(P)-dependent dehydrogenase (short-subunit alcohol dehydrogenase family)